MTEKTDEEFEYVRRVLACGSNFLEFRSAYYATDNETRARLARVAWRIWATLTLRYRQRVVTHRALGAYDPWRVRREWHALELYLLVTCLDTLAGKSVFVHFDKWIRAKQLESTNVEEFICLYQDYQNQFGIRKNLKQLFAQLPLCAKEWVVNVIDLVTEQEYFSTPENLSLDVEGKIGRIFRRLFTYRNTYTHSSIAEPPIVSNDLQVDPAKRAWVTYFLSAPDEKGRKMYVRMREGIDEATILRVLLTVIAAQRLQVPISYELIESNVQKYSRLDGLYGLMYEMANNSDVIHDWTSDRREENYWPYLWRGVPKLTCKYPEALLGRLLENTFERGLGTWLERYLTEVRRLNDLIERFNESSSPFDDDRGREGAYAELRAQRYPEIESFFKVNREALNSIAKFTQSNEYDNLWMLIRDPCYS